MGDPLLEVLALLESEAVRLADDGNEVDKLAEVLHGLNIDGLEAGVRRKRHVSKEEEWKEEEKKM